MLADKDIVAAANRLYMAAKDRVQIAPLTMTCADMEISDAYAIQKAWGKRRTDEGARMTGYKIGLTSRSMQIAMKIDSPNFGCLFDDSAFANGDAIRAADYVNPCIEAEFAFVMKDSLFGKDLSIEQVLEATDYVTPALELVATRSRHVDPETGYRSTVLDTISDNAANAGYVLGSSKLDPAEFDLRWAGSIVSVNAEIKDTGLGGNVMGHPASSLCWLCERLASHDVGLEAGQLVLAGAMTKPFLVAAGDTVFADYGKLGTIEVSFV